MNSFDVLVQVVGLLLVCSLYLLHVRTVEPRPSRRTILGRVAGVGLVWVLCAAVLLAPDVRGQAASSSRTRGTTSVP